MKPRSWLIGGVLAIISIATLSSTFYTVSETEQVVITQFGQPIGVAVTQPGLHVKLPFAQDVNVFDKRWLEWTGNPNQVPTRDKKYIWVETYARWRIDNPLLFFQRLRDERGAQSRIDDIIDGDTRNVIANHNLIEVVRVSNRVFEKAEDVEDVMETEAMRQVEFRHRSEGQGKSAEIRGKKERELKVIESEAYRKTQEIMGRGDAEATGIYAAAYNKDRELYRFVRTMDTYKAIVDKNSWLVLSTGADIFKYMQSVGGGGGGGGHAPAHPPKR